MSTLSAVAEDAGSTLPRGLESEMRSAAGLAFRLALQFGMNPARLELLSAGRGQTVVVGAAQGFVDCEEGEARRGERLPVVLLVSPGLQRVGDGRSDTTRKRVIVPCEVFTHD